MIDAGRGKRALVTGASGFLGRHLCHQLISEGWEVRSLTRRGDEALAALGVELKLGSVTEAGVLIEAAEGCDQIYHLAGSVERSGAGGASAVYDLHLQGARALIAAVEAEPERPALALSSSGTVGVAAPGAPPATEESPIPWGLLSRWPYYSSKAYAEEELRRAAARGLPIYLARPSLFLGPGDLRGSGTRDVSRFLGGQLRACPPGGIALVDVRDVAAFLPRLIEAGEPGVGYLLSAANLSLRAFFQLLSQQSGVPAPPFDLPKPLLRRAGPLLRRLSGFEALGGLDPISFEMGCYSWHVDSSRAEALGFSARAVEETLADTVEDLERRGLFFREQ